MREHILGYEFSVQVLPADTEDLDVLQIVGRMNSTGSKLNDQELRNAQFFGAFKERMYQLAYEQLDRWRTWRIFSETDIARMLEVEETGDIVITMLSGVHGKTQKRISDTCRSFDQSFPQASEIARRFQMVTDAIDEQVGEDLHVLEFRRKPLFHTLFTFYYGLVFSLGSPLRRAPSKMLRKKVATAVITASDQIAEGKVSDALAKVLRGATGHQPARQRRLAFLQETLRRVGR